MMKDKSKFLIIISVFIAAYFTPFEKSQIQKAIIEAFLMLQEYAQEHVLFCLIPAFFIAGAITIFIKQNAVMKYFGAQANKLISYSVASVSGTILAVCSCTILPIFAGIYKRGAGLGPAITFLYSGPAINILAIILTARVLGIELGFARAIGAIIFSIVIGFLMSLIFKKDEEIANSKFANPDENEERPIWKTVIYFVTLTFILIFAAWGKPAQPVGFWNFIFNIKWLLTVSLLIVLAIQLWRWFKKEELTEWINQTWFFTQQILPLLFIGVVIAGILMGRPESNAGLIPESWIKNLVGSNSISANFIASASGALMYFATLTEVPILQGLIGSGMSKGPALALLLAGPAVSLPNLLVIRSVLGNKKTLTYVVLVILMATLSGMIYGMM